MHHKNSCRVLLVSLLSKQMFYIQFLGGASLKILDPDGYSMGGSPSLSLSKQKEKKKKE